MLITIDTNNITQPDLTILTFILRSADATINTDAVVGAVEPEKPKRTRRTKAQIAADEAAAKAAEEAAQGLGEEETAGMDDSTGGAPAEEPTADSENAESDAADPAVTIDQLVEAASELINRDKTKMRAILDDFGVRKVSDVPEDRMAAMVSEIRKVLAA